MLGCFQKRRVGAKKKEKKRDPQQFAHPPWKKKKREEAAATLAITSYRHRGKQLVRDRRNAEPTVCETRAASEE